MEQKSQGSNVLIQIAERINVQTQPTERDFIFLRSDFTHPLAESKGQI